MKKSLNLKALFHPRSEALIGASTEPTKLSGRPFRFFLEFGYAGSLYPVNPKYQEIAGVWPEIMRRLNPWPVALAAL
ncbi:MAG: CoA-binding protein [Candidatus Binatia bacterium]